MADQNERQIFQYHNGSEAVGGDPLELQPAVRYIAGEDPNTMIEAINAAFPKDGKKVSQEIFARGYEARQKFVEAVRKAFKLTPTLGLEQVLDVWNDLNDFLTKKKMTCGTNQKSSLPAVPASSNGPSPTPITSAST